MDLSKMTKPELFAMCAELNIDKYKSKSKLNLFSYIFKHRL